MAIGSYRNESDPWNIPADPPRAAAGTPGLADFERDYWAPDRDAVLARMRGTPTPTTAPASTATLGFEQAKWNDPSHTTPKYVAGRIGAAGGSLDDILKSITGYQKHGSDSVVENETGDIYDLFFDNDNASGQRRPQWTHVGNTRNPQGAGGSGGAGAPGASGPTYPTPGSVGGPQGTGPQVGAAPSMAAQGNAFTDPATTGWETLLRQLVDRMNVPNPTWSPAQLELQQTQLLDPTERLRTQQKQQQAQNLAQRGITPGSGIFEQAMADIDRQFNQLSTQNRAGFATQAIGQEENVRNQNEQRATSATNLMGQIPALADKRLGLAQQGIQKTDPYQLLNLVQQIQNQNQYNSRYDQGQQQQFYANLLQSLLPLFGG